MACHEVTGSICWDDPEPVVGVSKALAKQIVNNNTPDTYPYMTPTPTWGTNPGSGPVLPTVQGWALKGAWTGPNVYAAYWKFETLQFSMTTGYSLQITLQFTNISDVVFYLPPGSVGPYIFEMPDDYLEGIIVDLASLTAPQYNALY